MNTTYARRVLRAVTASVAAGVLALAACGGRSESAGASDVDASAAIDAADATDFALDSGARDAAPEASPFADADACASRPVATCATCDASYCWAPMVYALQRTLEACGWEPTMCGTNLYVDLDATGCVTNMSLLMGKSGMEACVASKLAAARFPPECTRSATTAHTMNTCGPQ